MFTVPSLIQSTIKRAIKLNDTLASSATNAADWLFRRDQLVQSGKTEYEVIFEKLPMRVRYYAPKEVGSEASISGETEQRPARQMAIPLLMVPPLGVTSETFDLLPNRSVVKHMANAGYRVYMIDWGKPTRAHAHLGLQDYADEMMSLAREAVRQHSGVDQVSLFGWCMGGLLCLLHAGLEQDERIQNLVTVASPIDLRSGRNVMSFAATTLNTTARFVRKYTEFRLDNINPGLMGIPGWMVSLGFKMTAPIASVTTYWDLITRISDRDFVEQHTTTSDYLNNMMLYPGGVIRDFMVRFAIDNRMAKGKVKVGEKTADLANISASMLVFAGDTDHLVPAGMAKQSLDLVSSEDKLFMRAPGGHMGVILGSKAPENVWQVSADWLRPRSAVSSRNASASVETSQQECTA